MSAGLAPWRDYGRVKVKKEGARRMLAEIYNWFTEGFNTTDLPEAKGLLEALSVEPYVH